MTALLAASPTLRLPNPMRRRRGGWPVALSAVLHVGLLLLAILTARHERPFLEPAPPAPIAMVFQSGGKTPPSIANPAPKAPNQSGSPAPVPTTPPGEAPLPPAPLLAPPPPAPPAAPAPALPPQATETAPPAPAPPVPAPPLPARMPALPTPSPPPASAQAAPAEATPAIPLPPPAPSLPRTAQPQAAPRGHAMTFPAPMDFSFGTQRATLAAPAHQHRPSPGTIDLSFSPKAGGGEITQLHPYGDTQEVGSDWDNLLTKWWIEHRYYPEEAARLDQQGEVVLHLKVAHDGHVTSVELQKSSGSPWIDLAALGTLRDANLPPLPKDFTDPDLDLIFELHYILIQ